jgi:quercetin dioxygenase-like cupin family protein
VGEGQYFSLPTGQVTVKAGAHDAGAAFGVAEYIVPPGAPRSSPHRHNGMDEAAYLLRGELVFQLDNRTLRTAAGSFVSIPRGVVHAFLNPASEPASFLVIFSEPGFTSFWEELAALAEGAPDGKPAPAAVLELGRKHNTEFVDLPMPQY